MSQTVEIKKTSLHQQHEHLGAKIFPFCGWDMPLEYASAKNEALAVRNSCGVFDVSHMGEIAIKGNDSTQFLESLCPADLESAFPGKAIYSFFMNEAAGFLDDCIIYKKSPHDYLVCVNAGNTDKIFRWFSQNIAEFEIKIQDQSMQTSLIAIQGPESKKFLQDLIPSGAFGLEPFSFLDSLGLIIAQTGYTGEHGFEIFGPHLSIAQLWKTILQRGATPCGLIARDVLRIEACYPLYGQEINETTRPDEAGLSWVLRKQNKQNFIGRKALENGAPKVRLIKFHTSRGIPRQGLKIFNAQNTQLGSVSSGTYSPTLKKGIGMAHVLCAKSSSDDLLFLELRSKKEAIHLIQKNFLN